MVSDFKGLGLGKGGLGNGQVSVSDDEVSVSDDEVSVSVSVSVSDDEAETPSLLLSYQLSQKNMSINETFFTITRRCLLLKSTDVMRLCPG